MIACTSIPRTNDVQKKPFLVGPPDTSISFPTSASATMLIYNPSIHAKSVTATPTSQVPTLQLRLSYRFANSLASLNPSARNFEAWQPHSGTLGKKSVLSTRDWADAQSNRTVSPFLRS